MACLSAAVRVHCPCQILFVGIRRAHEVEVSSQLSIDCRACARHVKWSNHVGPRLLFELVSFDKRTAFLFGGQFGK